MQSASLSDTPNLFLPLDDSADSVILNLQCAFCMIAFSIANNFSIDADAFAMVSVFVVKVVKKSSVSLNHGWHYS